MNIFVCRAFEKEDAKTLLIGSGVVFALLCAAAVIESALQSDKTTVIPVDKQTVPIKCETMRINH